VLGRSLGPRRRHVLRNVVERSTPSDREGCDDSLVPDERSHSRRRLVRAPEVWLSPSDVERIAFFSDAVFAIAITLLVVELAVPKGPASELGDALRDLGPKLFAFVLSFLVIGQFWMAHHRVFRHVRRYDLGLVWLNLLYLLGVAFLPFPTALLGSYFESRLVGVFYGMSLFVPSALGALLWFYADRRRLVEDVPEVAHRQIGSRALATPLVFLLGCRCLDQHLSGRALLDRPASVDQGAPLLAGRARRSDVIDRSSASRTPAAVSVESRGERSASKGASTEPLLGPFGGEGCHPVDPSECNRSASSRSARERGN
jgi:uncharacterized membrane protein